MDEKKKVKHILVVDDDPVTRRVIGGVLAIDGYEILYAEDGNIGREMARRLKPDLVLMDIRMPVMDGITAATRMKEEAETKDIPIIFLSNEDLSIEAQKLINESGVAGYIPKALAGPELRTELKKILAKIGLS